MSKARNLVTYTLWFLAMFAAMSAGVLFYGKGFLWGIDGLWQQYSFFLLEGDFLREWGAGIAAGQFAPPAYSELVGYGADYVESLASNIGNPFNLLAVFSTPQNAELLLTGTVVAELWCAGALFLLYCQHYELDDFASIAGAIVYAFSGFSALAFTQIFMVYYLVLGPLLLLGVDKVFKRANPVLFVVAVGLCFLSSLNMGYQVCFLLFVYCIVRWYFLPETKSFVQFAGWFGRIFGLLVCGIALGALFFVPTTLSVLAQGRLSVPHADSLLYSLYAYVQIYQGLISVNYVGADCFSGYAPIAALCAFWLFAARRSPQGQTPQVRMMRVLCVLFCVFLCLPVFGKIFNGFSYANNRWVWALSLLMGVIVARTLPQVAGAAGRTQRVVAAITCGYLLLGVVSMAVFDSLRFEGAAVLLAVSLVLVCFSGAQAYTVRTWRLAVASICVLACGFTFATWQSEYIVGTQVSFSHTWQNAFQTAPAAVLEQAPDMVQRYDVQGFEEPKNGNIAWGVPGTTFYNSFYNSAVDEYHTSLGLTGQFCNYAYNGMEGRTPLQIIAGVNALVAPTNPYRQVSPLFAQTQAQVESHDVAYSLYETDTVLPLVSMAPATIARKDYNALSLIQRENVLLDAVVVDDTALSATRVDAPSVRAEEIEVDADMIVPARAGGDVDHPTWPAGALVAPGAISARTAGDAVAIKVQVPAGKTAYLQVEGLRFDGWSAAETFSESERAELSRMNHVRLAQADLLYDETSHAYIFANLGSTPSQERVTQYITQANEHVAWYGDKHDWLVNLGAADVDRTDIYITFSSSGVYSYDRMSVVLEDPQRVAAAARAYVAAASEGVQSSYDAATDTLTAQVSAPAEGALVFARMPYSLGWQATVDGQPVNIARANVAFMGLEVPAGNHTIELHYANPYLGYAALLSLLGVCACILLQVRYTRKRRTSNQEVTS